MHTPLLAGRHVVLDTESTGFSPDKGDRLIEFGALELIDGRPTGRTVHGVYWPERAVPSQAAQVHGWTTERLRGKPLFRSHAADVAGFLDGATLWAHNAAFDAKFLRHEMARAGQRADWTLSCSLLLARSLYGKGSYKLADLAARAGHRWTGAAHGAMADVRALVDVLLMLQDDAATRPSAAPAAAPSKRAPRAAPPVGAPDTATPQATKPAPAPPLESWTGPKVPAHDPRLAPAQTLDVHPFAQGKPWTRDEDALLRARFLEGGTLRDLARAHGRSPAALALRLEKQGLIAANHAYANLAYKRP